MSFRFATRNGSSSTTGKSNNNDDDDGGGGAGSFDYSRRVNGNCSSTTTTPSGEEGRTLFKRAPRSSSYTTGAGAGAESVPSSLPSVVDPSSTSSSSLSPSELYSQARLRPVQQNRATELKAEPALLGRSVNDPSSSGGGGSSSTRSIGKAFASSLTLARSRTLSRSPEPTSSYGSSSNRTESVVHLKAPSAQTTNEGFHSAATSPSLSVKTITGEKTDASEDEERQARSLGGQHCSGGEDRRSIADSNMSPFMTPDSTAFGAEADHGVFSPSPPFADLDAAEDGDESAPEEYVVALHDFSSNNATCLSFDSGQVIRVFNRDESGWWDGELNGQRGWFPSNYVDESGLSDASEMSTDQVDGLSGDFSVNEDLYPTHSAVNAAQRWYAKYETSAPSSNSQHTATTYASTVRPLVRQPSRSPTPTAKSVVMNAAGRGTKRVSIEFSSILEPIRHAISLLHNAVRANRVAHFQPSTACVISSVRSVLSSTDCLTRESSVLRSHPALAKERKQILAELSKLVAQARKASSFAAANAQRGSDSEEDEEGEEQARLADMEHMLRMADQVLFNVRRFLDVAVQCGVSIPDKRSSVYDDLIPDNRTARGISGGLAGHGGGARYAGTGMDRNDSDKTPTPDSPRSSTYRTAYTSDPQLVSPRSSRSYVDLRQSMLPPSYYHPGESHPMTQAGHVKAQALARTRFGSVSSTVSSSNSPEESTSDESVRHSPDESTIEDGPVPYEPKECAPSEIMERIQHANDHLLSIIAAFIGHIHGHTRSSHASSYAFLIDMTRATVDGVRTLLVIVEAVHGCQILQSKLPRQTAILWETRESVYEATAALVTAARIITSSSAASAFSSSLTTGDEGSGSNQEAPQTSDSPDPSNGEDDEKAKLLQAATAVLRTGGECVGAVKLCLNRAEASLLITLAMPASMFTNAMARSERLDAQADELNDDEEAGERHLESMEHGRRGKHTLSYLGRKATSLSCLRERYEQDDRRGSRLGGSSQSRFERIVETGNEGSIDHLTATGETSSAGAESSDSSEPMSRDHSRASASTVQSIHTPNTSARTSMDRGETTTSTASISLDDHAERIPHSAPPLQRDQDMSNLLQQQQQHQQPHIRNRSVSLAYEQSQSDSDALPSPSSASSPSFPSPPRKVGRSLSSDARILAPDYEPSEVCFNSEGQLTGATLRALVEKMTPHSTTTDATLSNAFLLCFRLFTTPMELFEVVEARYNMRPPAEIEERADDFIRWSELKVAPIRLRVFNFLKVWLEAHWNASTDFVILEPLIHFSQTSMTHSLHKPGQRLAEIAQKRLLAGPNAKVTTVAVNAVSLSRGPGTLKRMVSSERIKNTPGLTEIANLYTPSAMSKTGVSAPQPIVSKTLMNQLKSTSVHAGKINVMDFDPMELARQITVMESRIFCSILPEELLGQEFSKKASVSGAVHVKQMSALSTQITGWVSECILSEEDARKRTQLVKFFIKVGDRCLGLNNFNALFAIQGALNSSTIARLKRTWDGLPTKYRHLMDQQRFIVEHTRNFAGYRQRLRTTLPPALPFVGLFLTDLTFCHEGNASTRPSHADPTMKLLNFDKYVKMSRIIGDLQRFQQPYALLEVPEMQAFLHDILQTTQESKTLTAEELYRRSLRLEPRNNSCPNESAATKPFSTGTITNRSGLSNVGMDIFNWK